VNTGLDHDSDLVVSSVNWALF